MKKTLWAAALLAVLMLVGCEKQVEEDQTVRIGFSMDTLIVERWQKDRDIMSAKTAERGYELITLNANENSEKQIGQINQLIEEDVDVIIVIPFDKDSLTDVLQKASSKGIKIISYDRLIMNAAVDAYISFDNVRSGELMAQALMDRVGEGDYAIINGSPKDNNSFMLNTGYKNVMGENEDVSVVEEVWADDWREEVAYTTVTGLLDQGTAFDGIIAANDRLAEEAIRALTEYGQVGQIKVVGQDADLIACRNIAAGRQVATIYKPITSLVDETLDLVESLISTGLVAQDRTIDNGRGMVPYHAIEPILVNEDNLLDTVVNDGYHQKEMVFGE